ncbi:putative dehydrogenase [Luteibacter sp. HA06]
MSERLRLGFAGVGWIGRHRLDALISTGDVEVAALADPDPTCIAEALRLAPSAVECGSYAALLEQAIDGVVIATPSAAHASQAIEALERGMAVFCQKPLGRNGLEVRRVVEAARNADRRLGVDLSYRFLNGMAAARRAVLEGQLGTVYAVQATFHNAYGPGKEWFYDRKQSGGGCVIDLGIHLVDLALWMLGNPAVVDVRGNCFAEGQPLDLRADTVEDYATATIVVRGGAVVDLACSWKLPVGCDAEISFRVYGTHGGIGLRNLEGSFYDFQLERFDGRDRTLLAGPPDAWGGRAIIEWASGLKRSRAFDPEAASLIALADVLDRIYGA